MRGAPADFDAATGFVARAEPGAALLRASGETLLLAENALRIAVDAPARARLYLEPASAPALVVERIDPGAPRLVGLAELRVGGASDHAGVLRIELDDAPFVARATPAPRRLSLAFRYTPVAPALAAQLVAGGVAHPLLEGGGASNPLRVEPDARLLVRATPPTANLLVEAECSGALAPSGAQLLARSGGAFELPLELASEGLYTLTVRKYVSLAHDEKGPQIPPEHVFRIALDRTPPEVRITLEGAAVAPDARVRAGDALFKEPFSQRIRVGLREAAGLAALRWTLTRPDGTTRGGALEPPLETRDCTLELAPLLEHQQDEGRYELELVAVDRAGNTGRATGAWQVARSGPALALREPLVSGADRTWVFGSERTFDVRVRADDPNGVAAVRARVVVEGRPGPELELEAAPGDLWELPAARRPSVYPWWTGKELVLELTARDAAGFETPRSEGARVPELPRASVLVIAPRERPAETMVEIAAGGEYVFGGRSGEGQPSWSVPIPRGALRPFYLDAREVSRGEFLAFVRSETGYADPRWWPAGRAGDAERAARLAVELETEPERAATGIAWAEASAYAAWRGKRLPTLLEWEFAVRGDEYRAAPASETPRGAPPEWPANLCTGAREWTATPERLMAGAHDFASQCKRHPERLLAPDPERADPALASAPLAPPAGTSGAHWVVGARAGEAQTWNARNLRPDAPGPDDVGFRCALGREGAHSLLDRGEYVIVE